MTDTPAAPAATTPTASAPGGAKSDTPASPPWFFYGTAAGVVLATAIALVGFLFVRGRDADRIRTLQADLTTAKESAAAWKKLYDTAESGDGARLEAFHRAWQRATIPLQKRHVLLAFRPGPATTNDYFMVWQERYTIERANWWSEIEQRSGTPAMPEEDPEPNADMAIAFLNLGSWSWAAGEHRDAEDALKVALLWSPPGLVDTIRQTAGHYRYAIPDDIRNSATPEHIDKLRQFEGQWVDESNRELITRFEAEARGE